MRLSPYFNVCPDRKTAHLIRYLDGAAGFRNGRTYPLRYQVLDSGEVSIDLSHVLDDNGRPADMGPLVLSAEDFKKWFQPLA